MKPMLSKKQILKRTRELRRKIKRDHPILYKARILRKAYKALGHDIPTERLMEKLEEIKTCDYCNNLFDPLAASLDHILPKSRGGSNELENLHLVCFSCNLMKGNLTDSEFRDLLRWLLDKPEVYVILKKRLKAAGFMYGG